MSRNARLRVFGGVAALALLALAAPAHATVCIIGPDGSLPPQCIGGEQYLSPDDVHMIIDGLPPGTTIKLGAEHGFFFDVQHAPDGAGGETEQFKSTLTLHLEGTGEATGYVGLKTMQTQDMTHISADMHPHPRVRSFDTEMLGIAGEIPPGDPDFDLLRIRAGTSFGMPSPGHTTLVRQPGGNWAVDSFFDITYRIDFVGNPMGPFGGMSGSTTGTIRMQVGESSIPEPATMGLLGIGIVGMLGLAKRSRSSRA